MATYNILTAELTCPRCRSTVEMGVDCYFGCTSNMHRYRVGDIYDWPLLTDINGEGYSECPVCQRDFFAVVSIVDGKISEVKPDLTRAPYIPDVRIADCRLRCPLCGCFSMSEVHFYESYPFCRVIMGCDCNAEMHIDLPQPYTPGMETALSLQGHPYIFETHVQRNT